MYYHQPKITDISMLNSSLEDVSSSLYRQSGTCSSEGNLGSTTFSASFFGKGIVTFPTPYKSIPIVSIYSSDTSVPENNGVWIGKVTETGFTFGCFRYGNSVKCKYTWEAIGSIGK